MGNDLENSIVLQRATVPNLEMKLIKWSMRKSCYSASAAKSGSEVSLVRILVLALLRNGARVTPL